MSNRDIIYQEIELQSDGIYIRFICWRARVPNSLVPGSTPAEVTKVIRYYQIGIDFFALFSIYNNSKS